MSRNIVPSADGAESLGTSAKNWNSLYAKTATIQDDLKVGSINGMPFLTTPNLYEPNVSFSSPIKTTIASPDRCRIEINNAEYDITERVLLNVEDHSSWDYQAVAWQANTVKAVNDAVYPAEGKTGFVYVATSGGTTGSSTPTWPTTVGATYNDGSVIWQCVIDRATAAKRAGQDSYIYACVPATGTEAKLLLSDSKTVPFGYTALTARKVGGFHCLCVDVGTISGHTLSGYTAGNILPLSVWDLKHRPVSAPEGMVFVEGINKWVDIYLASYSGGTLVSAFNQSTADGASSPIFHGEKFIEQFGLQKKTLVWRDEFVVFAKGSNEETNIMGSADAVVTGGHIDTNSRRMISNYGIEDCCGFLWQWCRDIMENTPGSTFTSGNYWLNGYSPLNDSVYNSQVDSRPYGKSWGLLRRARVGGGWDDGTGCGSRSASLSEFSSHVDAYYGARGASEPI